MTPAMMVWPAGKVRILRDNVLVGGTWAVDSMLISSGAVPVDDDFAIAINGKLVIDQRRFSASRYINETLTPGQATKLNYAWTAGYVQGGTSPWVSDGSSEPFTFAVGDEVEVFAVNVNPNGWKTSTWTATISYGGGRTEVVTGGVTNTNGKDPGTGAFRVPIYRSMGRFRIPA